MQGSSTPSNVFTPSNSPQGTVTATKIAANAILASHIQADAVVSRIIKPDEKFVVGTPAINPIVLDGTATDNDPLFLSGTGGDAGEVGAFAVTRVGDQHWRQSFGYW